MTTSAPPIVAVVGPTASGKTALALALTERFPLEILSADSRQVYRGMDVGTAKPSPAERAAVPHHLLDLVAPDERFTVADWVAQARALLPQIAARGHLPLVVGGTGLYVTALLDGYDFGHQPGSAEARRRLTDELNSVGLAALAARLGRLAPELAASTDLRNPRRVLRALERAESGSTARPGNEPWDERVCLIGLGRPREVLEARIAERARRMFAGGLLAETRALLDAGYSPELPSMSGHGYAEAIRHLAGEWNLEQAIAGTVVRSRQYAKRQLTWLGRDARLTWIAAGERDAHDEMIVRRAVELLQPIVDGDG